MSSTNTAPAFYVSETTALAYKNNIPIMLHHINETMSNLNESENLIGNNPLSVMLTNHQHHTSFMVNVFKSNDYSLLSDTLQWVFSSYQARGFKPNYFNVELSAWINVIQATLSSDTAKQIVPVYEWMKSRYADANFLLQPTSRPYPFDSTWETHKNTFAHLLLAGNAREALVFAQSLVHDCLSLESFYTKVITPAMYDVGKQWEVGAISIAQEHLATSIVMRVIASLYATFSLVDTHKGKAIVTSCVNEYHEIGARILADLFELDGWDIQYLGANTPTDELIKMIEEERPIFVCLSVTMSFNIDSVIQLIKQIRQTPLIADTKLMVGGYAFTFGKFSAEQLGADKLTLSVEASLQTANEWWYQQHDVG
jgi:methanogenic corrinoid protein MtbC1